MTSTPSARDGIARRRPTPLREPSELIVFGSIGILAGWVVAFFLIAATGSGGLAMVVGMIGSFVGGLVVTVGVIAAGVRLGMRWVEHDRLS